MKSIFADNDIIDPRFKDTEFVVEADSYSQHELWYNFHAPSKNEIEGRDYGVFIPNESKVEWEQDNCGTMYQTGILAKRPVCTTFLWVKLDGHRIVFYENTSQVVDTVQVEKWLNKHCCPRWDKGTRIARTNASNFHHVIHHVKGI
jgi:hypothetical protein